MSDKLARIRRKRRIRTKVSGSVGRPRLSVFRSAKHIYAQIIDDENGATLVAESTLSADVRGRLGGQSKRDAATVVGEALAQACKSRDIDKVVFDRNGYRYHGRIRALAEAARKAGLSF